MGFHMNSLKLLLFSGLLKKCHFYYSEAKDVLSTDSLHGNVVKNITK